MTILCLDPGTAHTGLAISYDGQLVEPLHTLYEKNLDLLVGRLTPFIARHNPKVIVIGQPDHGPLVDFAQKLKTKLTTIFAGDIVLFDESLSSQMSRSKLREAGKKYAEIKQKEHQTAAALILQDYLETL